MLFSRVLGGASVAALSVISSAAHAQQASPAKPAATVQENTDATVGDVIVTAQRRSESALKVPISIQAIGGDELDRRAILSTTDLASISPTLNYTAGPSAAASAFVLRGVSSIAQEGGIQPSTALVIDGVPVFRQGEFVANLSDIDRVELLSGPQGTLFGKNSTAGVINIITRQPARTREASFEGGVTTDGEWLLRGMVNVPFSDDVRMRVNAYYNDQSPIVRNIGPAGDVAGQKSYGFDLKLAFNLSSAVELGLQGTYNHRSSSYNQSIPIIRGAAGALMEQIDGFQFHRGVAQINTDMPAIDNSRFYGLSGTIKWHASEGLELTSITSYRNWSEDNYLDVDLTPTGYSIGVGPSAVNPLSYPLQWINVGFPRLPDTYHYFTEEARANYSSGPVTAVAGIFYQSLHGEYDNEIPFAVNANYFGFNATSDKIYFDTKTQTGYTDRIGSAFGDITVSVMNEFKIFGGLRYTAEHLTEDHHRQTWVIPFTQYNAITNTPSVGPTAVFNPAQGVKTVHNLSGRIGVQFLPAEGFNFYASYARGYKSPAFDASTHVVATRQIIDPEIADGFEIGAKMKLFNRRLAINVDAFYETIDGIQEDTVDGNGGLSNLLINAGRLITKGFEGDFQWAATSHLRLTGGFVYNDASYRDFYYACNAQQTKGVGPCRLDGTQDMNGAQAIGAPRFKYSLGVTYGNQLGQLPLKYHVDLNWVHVSSTLYDIGQDRVNALEPGHGLLSAQIGVKTDDGHWELDLYAKNLTNKFYYSWLVTAGVIANSFGTVARDYKTYGGVRIKYNF